MRPSRLDERIRSHLDRVVRGTVEETLNALLDAEADLLCNAQRYKRSAARRTRAGHYQRGLQTKAGEVRLMVPKVRRQTFETAIIERYRRRESSVEEADACLGLAESTAEFFPDAAWQRCVVVHWYRNIFSHVPSIKVREFVAMLKVIHASEDIAAAHEKATLVIEKLRGLHLARAAELVEGAVEDYDAFPQEHWRRIRRRILREIRQRTRVVGAFPDGQSALNLAAARLRHIAGTAWSTKRYLNSELLKDQQMRAAIPA